MQEKKIHQLDDNSFAITLPMNWATKNNISKNAVLNYKEYNNSILFYSNTFFSQEKTAYIDFNSISLKLFNKLVISHYIKNFSKIIITGDELDQRFEYIKTYIKKLPGLQIISIKSSSIELKNDTKLRDVHIDELILNIEDCINSMFEQLQHTEPKKTYFQIQELDTSINELYLLAKKSLNYSTQIEIDIEVVSKALMYSKIIAAYEKIGDILKRISRYYKIHITNPEEIIPLINPTINHIMQYHNAIINFKKSPNEKYNHLNSLHDAKNSILREIDEQSNLRKSNYTLELVISQLIKDVLGEYDKIIETSIDSCE